MSVQSEIDRIITAVGNAYSKVSEKGGTVPASQTIANLATAINSIPLGGSAPSLQSKSVIYTANGTGTITPDDGYDGLSSVDVTVDVSGGGGGAKEPYIEETYNSNGDLIDVNLVGYTVIRRYAFYGCTNLALTSLPSGITSIGYDAFYDCRNLALTSLPSGITSIENEAFQNCQKLALTSLPSGITSIGSRTFSGCKNLALTSLPSGITDIGAYSFRDCTGLTSITFHGKPRAITANAFNGCTNLKTINVPWASGEVANAPWGAKNATINYNYTG